MERPEKCHKCHHQRPKFHFYDQNSPRTACITCRISGAMTTAWYEWSLKKRYTELSEDEMKTKIKTSKLQKLVSWKEEMSKLYPQMEILPAALDRDIRKMIDETRPKDPASVVRRQMSAATMRPPTKESSSQQTPSRQSKGPKSQASGARCERCIKQNLECDKKRPCGKCKHLRKKCRNRTVVNDDFSLTEEEMWNQPAPYQDIIRLKLPNNLCDQCGEKNFANYHFFTVNQLPGQAELDPWDSCLYCRASGYIFHDLKQREHINLSEIEDSTKRGSTHPDSSYVRPILVSRLNSFFSDWKSLMCENAGYEVPIMVEHKYRAWAQKRITRLLEPQIESNEIPHPPAETNIIIRTERRNKRVIPEDSDSDDGKQPPKMTMKTRSSGNGVRQPSADIGNFHTTTLSSSTPTNTGFGSMISPGSPSRARHEVTGTLEVTQRTEQHNESPVNPAGPLNIEIQADSRANRTSRPQKMLQLGQQICESLERLKADTEEETDEAANDVLRLPLFSSGLERIRTIPFLTNKLVRGLNVILQLDIDYEMETSPDDTDQIAAITHSWRVLRTVVEKSREKVGDQYFCIAFGLKRAGMRETVDSIVSSMESFLESFKAYESWTA